MVMGDMHSTADAGENDSASTSLIARIVSTAKIDVPTEAPSPVNGPQEQRHISLSALISVVKDQD